MSDTNSIVNKYTNEIKGVITANQNALKAEIAKKVNEAINDSQKNPDTTIDSKLNSMRDEIISAVKSSLPK